MNVVIEVLKGTRSSLNLKWLYVSLCCCFMSFCFQTHANNRWQQVSPGIEYIDMKNYLTPWSHIHVFRIQLATHQFSLIRASDLGLQQGFVGELAVQQGVKIAVNGGFFDSKFRPLGLRVHQSQKLNPLKQISWWGVFYIRDGQAYIRRASDFEMQSDTQFAIQSGPRLLVAGHIPPLKPGRDERTALGITQKGAVVIVVTENAPLTTSELAELMRRAPILATDALNLDGGSSTQLWTNMPKLHLDIHGFSMVADAVVVK
jgi:uncharacterized protein YigE (DUF2233 family)